MTELLAMTCDACGEPMLPNVSTLDADGCLWICINPRCPELHAEELDAADLEEAGVPQALAGRLARLILHYAEEDEAPPRTREQAQADLATLYAQLLEMGRLAETTAAITGRLDDALLVSYESDAFDEAQQAKQSLAVAAALCAAAGRSAAEALGYVRVIDPELPGFMPFGGE
ncbi:MAG: hypothetical protein JXA36_08100 [Coriobacteriia bacterium]|nr:hypothetical protein [Coriobacteriia bacterium]